MPKIGKKINKNFKLGDNLKSKKLHFSVLKELVKAILMSLLVTFEKSWQTIDVLDCCFNFPKKKREKKIFKIW